MGPNRLRLGAVANQPTDAMSAGDQACGDCAADKAVRAGDKDTHGGRPCCRSVDMTPNLAGRDSFFSVFRSIQASLRNSSGNNGRGHVLVNELALTSRELPPSPTINNKN